MTDTVALTLEDRVAALEARLEPRTLAPPITIGELTNTPAPGSQLAAQWAQDATGRIVHRYANRAALDAWAAPNGSFAVTLDDVTLYRRKAGVWSRITPYVDAVTGQAVAALIPAGTFVQCASLNVAADPAPRWLDITWSVSLQRFAPRVHELRLYVVNTPVTKYNIQPTPDPGTPAGQSFLYPATLEYRSYLIPANTAVLVRGMAANLSGSGLTDGVTLADPAYNRLSVSVVGA